MSSNERLLAAAYGEGAREEQRLLHSRAGEMEFQYTVRLAQRYMDPTKSVVEIGCATGRYGMYFADQCQAYLGVDLLPAHVERFARKIREKGLKNVRAMVGDATRLDGVADESCDVVLALGPMYHSRGRSESWFFRSAGGFAGRAAYCCFLLPIRRERISTAAFG